MTKDATIIFIATVPWSYNWQRQHEWATRLAKNNHVIYIQPFGMTNIGPVKLVKKLLQRRKLGSFNHEIPEAIRENITFLRPKILPWHDVSMINQLNARLFKRQVGSFMDTDTRPIFWVCNPVDTVNSILLQYPKSTVIYDIAMRFSKRADAPSYIDHSQSLLAKRAQIVLTDSRASASDLPEEVSGKINYVPQGVSESLLDLHDDTNHSSIRGQMPVINGKRIVYLGANHDSLDISILRQLVNFIPTAHLILTYDKPLDGTALNHPRVHYIGQIEFSAVPAFLREGDVGIIPYQINEFTEGVFPTKLFEYVAAGLPVVTTDLPELRQFSDKLSIASSRQQFVDMTKQALTANPIQTNRAFLEENTWGARFALVEKLLEQEQNVTTKTG